jgi:4-hydroxy-tetrahydrodipicolinate synthase
MKGVVAAALTPMRADLSIDRAAFSAHCRMLLDAGCHGLGVFGTTGEANSLSVAERTEALLWLISDGVPTGRLIPGTGACALPDAVALCDAALGAGVVNVLVLPPFYYKGVSDDGLFRFFAELIERVGDGRLQIFLYHIPPMATVGFSLDLIGRLLDAYPTTIAGTKDSAGDPARIERLCKEFPQLTVFAGSERFLLDTLRWGGDGCISATVNLTASDARYVYDLWDADSKQADAAQAALTEARASLDVQPLVPRLKTLMHELTGDDVWRNWRPPL